MRLPPLAGLLFALALAGCGREPPTQGPQENARLPQPPALPQVPLGDVAGPSGFDMRAIRNPYEGDRSAVESGRKLYMAMNCAYCHGLQAKGLIGPSLRDAYWRYGGSAAEIYLSVFEGRPKGMPAWGTVLPASSLWQMTAYIQSLEPEESESGQGARQPGSGQSASATE